MVDYGWVFCPRDPAYFADRPGKYHYLETLEA
jgi:hypothetical protein